MLSSLFQQGDENAKLQPNKRRNLKGMLTMFIVVAVVAELHTIYVASGTMSMILDKQKITTGPMDEQCLAALASNMPINEDGQMKAHHYDARTPKWNEQDRWKPMDLIAPCTIWYVGANTHGRDGIKLQQDYLCDIHVFEPIPLFASELQRNWENIPRSSIHEYGLGASTRVVSGLGVAGESTFAMEDSHVERGATAQIRSVIEVWREFHMPTIDLLHVNCEGCEWEMWEALLKADLMQHIHIMQVGTHWFPQIDDVERRYCRIERGMKKTHQTMFKQAFGWERWNAILPLITSAAAFDQNDESLVRSSSTVVTAYFEIPSKHSSETYLEWMQNFLSMDDTMVIFTTPDMITVMKPFREHKANKTYFVPMELSELPVAKRYNQTFWQNQLDMDYEKSIHKSFELFWIWLSKSWFVSEAVRVNPFRSDLFLYSDIGCFRSKDYNGKKLIRHKNVVPQQAALFLAWKTPDPPKNTKLWNDKRQGHFYQVGGWIAGYSSALQKFHQRFEEVISQFAARNLFVGEDQAVLMSTCLQYPELCEYVQAKDIPDDPWFGLRYVLHNGGIYDRWRPPPVISQANFTVKNGYLLLDLDPNKVNCGGNFAPTCADCLQTNGVSWCDGDCAFSSEDGRICKPFEHHSAPNSVKYVIHYSMRGRLGNQLFEHAATLALAKKSGKQACVIGERVNLIDDYFVGEHFYRNCSHVSPLQSIDQMGYAIFTPIPKSDESILLGGYLQSWKYFEGNEAEIKGAFTLKHEYLKKADEILGEGHSSSNNSFFNVGIHLRWFEAHHLIDPPAQFYSWAMDHFMSKYGQSEVRFYVASRDIKRAQRLDVFDRDGVLFLHETSTVLDFAILMKCDGMILSSGTFGWWAAWLGPHQRGGEVIYYSDIFDMNHHLNKGQVIKEDYYPPEWQEVSLENPILIN